MRALTMVEREGSTRAVRARSDTALEFIHHSPVCSDTNLIKVYLILCSACSGYFIGFSAHSILPARFFFDSSRIQLYVVYPHLSSADGSYRGTAILYKVLGLGGLPDIVVGHLGYLLALALVVLVIRARPVQEFRTRELSLVLVVPVLSGIFLFTYTKELFVVLLVLLFVVMARDGRGELAWVLVAVAYAYFVRQYWFIIIGIYIVLRCVTQQRLSVRSVLVGLGFSLVLLILIFNFVLHIPLNYYRTTVVADLSVSPDSVIVDPADGSSLIAQSINAVHGILVLLVPYPVLISLVPQQLVGGGVILVFHAVFGHAVWSSGRAGFAMVGIRERSMLLCISYVSTLSLFEPDYGSYLRHLLPVLPLEVLSIVLARLSNRRDGQTASRTDINRVGAENA